MAIVTNYQFAAETTETLAGITAAQVTTVRYSEFEVRGQLNATSTPPATKACYTTVVVTGAASGSLDLTALPNPLGGTQTMAGLKLQFIRISVTGDGLFTLQGGTGGNPYAMPTTFEVGPGESAMQLFADRLPDVGGSSKFLDYSSTDDVSANITMIFG